MLLCNEVLVPAAPSGLLQFVNQVGRLGFRQVVGDLTACLLPQCV
jgi:hypothetical protein